MWREVTGATSYRVVIEYSPSGEVFEFVVPAATQELYFPEAAGPRRSPPNPIETCLQRQAFVVTVHVVSPDGERFWGSYAQASGLCGP